VRAWSGHSGEWEGQEHVAAAAQHWVQRQVSAAACGWQSTKKSRVNRPTDHG